MATRTTKCSLRSDLEVAQRLGGCGGFVVGIAGDRVKVGAEIGAAFERAA